MTAINSFNGWMWNDEYLLGEGQYVYSENLDIYRDPRWIQLAVKPTLVVSWVSDLPIQMVYLGTDEMWVNRESILVLDNKNIVDTEWDIRYEWSTLRPVATQYRWLNAFVTVDNAILFPDYGGGILVPSNVDTPASWGADWSRDTDSKVWTPFALPMGSYSLLSNGATIPTLKIWGGDWIADWVDIRNIVQTSPTGGMPGGWVPFWPWYPTYVSYAQWISQPGENVYLSLHSDSVWSISRYLNAISSELSALAVVPLTSNEWVKQLAINKNTRFIHGTNKSGTDIVISGDELSRVYNNDTWYPLSVEYSSVYAYKIYWFGADAQQLIAKSRKYENVETAFDNHGVTFYLIGITGNTDFNWWQANEMVYCISNKDDVGLIYAYGHVNPGDDDSWSVIISKNSQWKKMRQIGCIYRSAYKNGFYFSYEDEDGVFGVDYYDDISIETPTSYQPSGKVFLRTDDGGDMSVNKEVLNLKLGCKVPEDTTIIISYILDNSGTEVVYDTITHTTQGSTDYKIYRGNQPVKGFKCISWFAELTTTGTTTPRLLNFNYDLWIIQN